MDKVIVTGGSGYVGSHACKALAKAGFTPVTIDNLEHGHRWAVKWGPLVECNLDDYEKISETIERYSPIAVMHFAAYTSVGESITKPYKYYRNNSFGTLSLLEVMKKHKVSKIIFSSTAATYGTPTFNPIPEHHHQAPINPYGTSKLIVEHMLQDAAQAYGLQFVGLRYFNAVGADPEGLIGEMHNPETHLIPLVLDTAIGRRREIGIFGDNYDTPDGTCLRDYVHVSDLADAHILALKSLLAGGANGFFNLGNGRGHSVLEVIDTARRITGRKISAVVHPRRIGDPAVLVADASAARRLLDWQPQRSTLEVQIGDAWKWHQQCFHHDGKSGASPSQQ